MMRNILPARSAKCLVPVCLLAGLLPWRDLAAESIVEAPLRGTYFLAGKTLVDPPPGEARDSHLYMEITGSAARALYARLKARPMEDPCGNGGETLKAQGGIQCSRDARGKDYRCWLGIDLAGQRVVNGRVC